MSDEVEKLKRYSVRSAAEWPAKKDTPNEHIYEERIVLFKATSFDDAIKLAEIENAQYCKLSGFKPLELYQCFEIDSEPNDHSEVFSLIRRSELNGKQYLDSFFDTTNEQQTSA